MSRAPAATAPADATPASEPSQPGEAAPTFPPQSYWDLLATGNSNSGAESIDEASAIAEVVVIGRWSSVERDTGYAEPGGDLVGWYATAIIEIDEVVRGTPKLDGGTLRVPFLLEFGQQGSPYPESALRSLAESLPDQTAMLFLVSWKLAWERVGTEVPEWLSNLNRRDVYRSIGMDGALPIDGESISDLVHEVDMPDWRRAAAGERLESLRIRISEAAPSAAP